MGRKFICLMKVLRYCLTILTVLICFSFGYGFNCHVLANNCGPGQPFDYYCVNVGGVDPCNDCGCYRDCNGNSEYCFA